MKVTKDKGTTIVEITKKELQMYKVTFEDMDCSDVHTRAVIRDILSTALNGEKSLKAQSEIILLPDSQDGCVIVCKEKSSTKESIIFEAVSFSLQEGKESEIFSCFFS